ncbi:MAG: ABC transporter permease [Clostridiales bacterium]|nr:ABC transporter permease [Clostridiales bacterium]
MNVAPGDPLWALIDQKSATLDEETARSIRQQWGLDQPLPIQYLRFLGNALKGDLGRSFVSRQKVTEAVLERAPATFKLGLAALFIALVLGLAAGMTAAVYRGSFWDFFSMVVALTGVSIPVFWLGLLLMYLLAVRWHLLPPSGYGDGRLSFLILPALTLGLIVAAFIARITRSTLLEVLSADYIRTARAKGLAERWVLYRHAFRNALLPIITIVGIQAGELLSGAVITETVFNWPGVGRLLVDSINKRDLPVVQGAVIFIALLFALINLVVDLLYAWADPRIRYE